MKEETILPIKITIPNFITEVHIKAFKRIYYKETDEDLLSQSRFSSLQGKEDLKDKFNIDKNSFIRDKKTNRKIVRKTTNNIEKVSLSANNLLFKMTPNQISAIFRQVKDSFTPFIQHLGKIGTYPLRVKLYVYDLPYRGKNLYDIGNISYVYGKSFLDLLVSGNKIPGIDIKPIIEEDNINFVTEDPQGGIFCPIDKKSRRRLVFLIGHDNEAFLDKQKEIEKDRQLLIKKWKKLEQ